MTSMEKHQSSVAAIRRMMFNVARKKRFFKREPGKKAKNRLKKPHFPAIERAGRSAGRFRTAFFGKHSEKTLLFG